MKSLAWLGIALVLAIVAGALLLIGGRSRAGDDARLRAGAARHDGADAPIAPGDGRVERRAVAEDAPPPRGDDASPGEAEAPEAPRIVVSGRLLLLGDDGQASPIAGREVQLGPASPPLATSTDADGAYRFVLGPVRDAPGTVFVRAPALPRSRGAISPIEVGGS